MNKEVLIEIWNDWHSRDDFTCAILDDGRKYVWAFGVLFSRKTCNVRIGESEIISLKRSFLNGKVTLESEDLEARRQAAFAVDEKAA